MAKQKAVDPAASLAKAIEESLIRRRSENAGYPVSLREVAQGVATDIRETDLRAALAKAPLKSRPVLAFDGDLDSLAVLKDKEDLELLACNDRVLRSVCERLCSPQSPTLDLASGSKLLSTALRKPFVTAWENRIAAGQLPAFVRAVPPGKAKGKAKPKTVLHDVRFPLPWVDLSERMVRELERQRGQGESLVEWSSLMLAVGKSDPGVLQQARQTEPLRSRVVPIFAKEPEGLVALVEDLERVATDSRILDRVLTAVLKPGDTLADIDHLKKQKILQPKAAEAFSAAVSQYLVSGRWPSGFGLGRNGAKRWLFRFRDVSGAPASGSPSHEPPEAPNRQHAPHGTAHGESQDGFAKEFAETFARLDHSRGGRNFVKLAELRTALPHYSREKFDSELRSLRIARQFQLSTSDGNHVTLTTEERAAGIQEADLLLVYCERIR